jgi:uncharacterized PurR-regulated membrane protein YhhQ (DUF165 family)
MYVYSSIISSNDQIKKSDMNTNLNYGKKLSKDSILVCMFLNVYTYVYLNGHVYEYVCVYIRIISNNDQIKKSDMDTNLNYGKKLNKDSILVSMCMYVYMDTCIYLNAHI